MDVFAKILTAFDLIIQFLDACSSYLEEAKSLKFRFSTYRRAVQEDQQLDPQYAALLEQMAAYLDSCASKAQKELHKFEQKGWLHDNLGDDESVARQEYLKDIQGEMFGWTMFLELHLLSLPQELKEISTASTGDEARFSAAVRSLSRLRQFFALPLSAKQTRIKKMFQENSNDLASEISGRDMSFHPLQYDEIIFASRRVPPGMIQGTSEFLNMQYDMGELAAALSCLDPAADIKLLKVEYYFYDAKSNHFLFAQKSPYLPESTMSLEEMISVTSSPESEPPLNDRLKLAYKIAEAVFFLHTAGFLHKNITSSSIVVLRRPRRRPHQPTDEVVPEFDDAYLMGFDLIRGDEAPTTKEGAVREIEERISPWDFDIFQHPDRLQGESIPRYIRTYDVYSLGVILLELGFWEPLSKIAKDLAQTERSSWAKELLEIVPQLRLNADTREKYQSLVTWCLNLKGNHIVKDFEFLREFLVPLNEMANNLV